MSIRKRKRNLKIVEEYYMRKHSLLFIGALPPPYHGVTIFNEELLNSKILEVYRLYHLDISDKRNLDNLGRIDWENTYLALRNLWNLIRLCLSKKPDLVYLPMAQNIAYLRDGMFIVIAGFFSKAKIIIHLHGSYFKEYYHNTSRFMRKFIDFTMNKVDTAIVVGNRLKYIFDEWVEDIQVVPNGTPFNPMLGDKFQRNRNTLSISYLSNLSKSKGVLDTIKAAKIVIDRYPNVQFKFAGPWQGQEPETKKFAFRFIRENHLENKIEFMGRILGDKKEKFLIDTDIFVFPSCWYEGHPIVIIEAMAAGCPVISTRNVGAIPETVIDGKTGILVEKKNPKAVAQAIMKLIESPNLRVKMGMAARKRYEQYYTHEKNIQNMLRVFDHTLKREGV